MATSEQIRRLTDEQQEALAKVELRLARKRQQLSEQARSYPGFFLVPSILALIVFCVFVFTPAHPKLLAFCVLALFALVQFHATSVNRRMNALVKLLDADVQSAEQSSKARDGKVA